MKLHVIWHVKVILIWTFFNNTKDYRSTSYQFTKMFELSKLLKKYLGTQKVNFSWWEKGILDLNFVFQVTSNFSAASLQKQFMIINYWSATSPVPFINIFWMWWSLIKIWNQKTIHSINHLSTCSTTTLLIWVIR